ncbi:hypothetical protein CC1G_07673 [Coprinopsis cinerea okayama7|uniref:NADH dehydrogenase [ubiquinone] 1 alpha subcomplex subunit n=1 Tax=Coprinopsis cinerea (strain Okayama-7 / 130 / ATCC MYA-4618 / FGSC 9003) TaxID=240176 RepID=A8NC69_COPC7|nr:hypothetical protein CC1G_07673 [Coprinopsis cinerea okayama7\|eukprot:XP_001832413.2 hypothetical protein CC1G_07673 [Coprinopsis cinerea okayama7\
MSFLSRIFTALRNPRRYVGRDLEGNKFYESPISAGSRPKRTVVYRREEDMWDYIGGTKRLPIQWSAWLSHTRPNPPTIEELEADLQRQIRVKYNASLIEAKDREEAEQRRRLQAEGHAEALRIQQGRGQTEVEGEPPVLASAFEKTETGKAESQNTASSKPQPSKTTDPDNPWAAADAPVETQSWTPKFRSRGG